MTEVDNLKKYLRPLLRSMDLSPHDLAKELEVTPNTVFNWIENDRPIKKTIYHAIVGLAEEKCRERPSDFLMTNIILTYLIKRPSNLTSDRSRSAGDEHTQKYIDYLGEIVSKPCALYGEKAFLLLFLKGKIDDKIN